MNSTVSNPQVETCDGCGLETRPHAVSACGDLVTERFYCSGCNRAWALIYGPESVNPADRRPQGVGPR